MVEVARANMFGKPVGTFRWDSSRNRALFEYVPEFLDRG